MSTEGFPKVDIELTDEQLSILQPLSTLLKDAIAANGPSNGGTLIAEMFVVPGSYKFKKVEVRYIDKIAALAVSGTLVAAQDGYIKRQAAIARLLNVKERMASNLEKISLDNDKVTFTLDGHKYEVREAN